MRANCTLCTSGGSPVVVTLYSIQSPTLTPTESASISVKDEKIKKTKLKTHRMERYFLLIYFIKLFSNFSCPSRQPLQTQPPTMLPKKPIQRKQMDPNPKFGFSTCLSVQKSPTKSSCLKHRYLPKKHQ